MKRWVMVLPMACALAACGTDDTRAADQDPVGAADNASKLRREAAAGSPGAAASRPEVVLHEGDGGVVDSIHVRRGGEVQTLKPSPNAVAPGLGADRISMPNLDFDGHADLALVTDLAAGTSRSEYWRYDPAAGRYLPLGNHETLQVDTAARALTTFNRGGHGGRIWTAARVALVDGALVPLRSEEQAWLEDAQAYVYIVRERRGSRLAEISRDTLADGEPRAGPSWDAEQQD